MDFSKPPFKCFITGVDAISHCYELDKMKYSVNYMNIPISFSFELEHKNSQVVNNNLHILRGLIANKLFTPNNGETLNNDVLESMIDYIFLPHSKHEKFNHLLNLLGEIKSSEDIVNFHKHNRFEDFLVKCYMKNNQQGISYFRELRSLGYLKFKLRWKSGTYKISTVFITPLGIEKMSSLS